MTIHKTLESNVEDKAEFISCWPRESSEKKQKVRVDEAFGISKEFVRLNLSEAELWLVKSLIGLIEVSKLARVW